jgi:hypothetical protein
MAIPFFKMSRSIRSRSFSRRSRAISAAWSAVGMGSGLREEDAGGRAASDPPPPGAYRFTQRHSSVGCTPISAATAVAVRPLPRASSAASRLYSSV